MKLSVSSTAFSAGKTIPQKYTCSGGDISPPLAWTRPPAKSRSIALICEDPDAPSGTFTHWVLYNLPPGTVALDEGAVPGGALQGLNDFRHIGYGGPCPPPGKPHHYYFKVYALDHPVGLPAGATKEELNKAMSGHILAEGELVGVFGG
ncbi:MAG: YbhB/YbcL family Raf kinase inhibitor-like protein [Verrucomicrobia bacterium]|nr:YbhB/YbcL family Raf kinase inhibitor-like protein [Verrucomicrobiota bacterium]MDE3100081.1 YbhB/YbcL family Raf kinase inhibitor-like protein [Verrucomicrobiota bacterium]